MRIVFIGTGDIGLPVLRALIAASNVQVACVVTQPDKPAGRLQKLLASPVKEVAMRHGLPVFQPKRIRDETAVDAIRAMEPQIIVVMAYGQILPGSLLRTPEIACLNLHASLLPRHRGAAPIQAAIDSGDRETGITVMYMDEGLDTGDILLQCRVPIRRRETAGSLHGRLAELAPDALHSAIMLLIDGTAPRQPQETALATHAPKLTRESGKIDWHAPAGAIERKIRAMNPWPAAHTQVPDKEGRLRMLKLFGAIRVKRISGLPGRVIKTGSEGILVGAGEGTVLLREVQLEGKRRMTAGDFVLGHSFAPGTILR